MFINSSIFARYWHNSAPEYFPGIYCSRMRYPPARYTVIRACMKIISLLQNIMGSVSSHRMHPSNHWEKISNVQRRPMEIDGILNRISITDLQHIYLCENSSITAWLEYQRGYPTKMTNKYSSLLNPPVDLWALVFIPGWVVSKSWTTKTFRDN